MTNNIPVLRCIHRHSIEEHPACFILNKINFQDEKDFIKKTGKPWWTFPEYKIGYLDIESGGFRADFDLMLTWAVKSRDGAVYSDCITKQEIFDGNYDRRITESLIDKMREYKILCTYYGTGFDIPFIRTKSLIHDLVFPGFGEIYHFDIYYTVKRNLKLNRNSLESVCSLLNVDGKGHVDGKIWRDAKYGDKQALRYVLKHNQDDVVVLEKVHNRLVPFAKWIRKSI